MNKKLKHKQVSAFHKKLEDNSEHTFKVEAETPMPETNVLPQVSKAFYSTQEINQPE